MSEPRTTAPTGGSWELFPHGSDVGVRGVGATLAEAFEQAALALTGVVTDPEVVEARRSVRVEASAPDAEVLLFEWINALVTRMAIDGLVFGRYRVQVDGEALVGEAWGEPVDVARHRPAVEVKGATFTELAVRRRADGRWVAQCVVDV